MRFLLAFTLTTANQLIKTSIIHDALSEGIKSFVKFDIVFFTIIITVGICVGSICLLKIVGLNICRNDHVVQIALILYFVAISAQVIGITYVWIDGNLGAYRGLPVTVQKNIKEGNHLKFRLPFNLFSLFVGEPEKTQYENIGISDAVQEEFANQVSFFVGSIWAFPICILILMILPHKDRAGDLQEKMIDIIDKIKNGR